MDKQAEPAGVDNNILLKSNVSGDGCGAGRHDYGISSRGLSILGFLFRGENFRYSFYG